jgi:hypothetical protein
MITGLGEIGAYCLEFLARTPGISSIIGADVNREAGLSKVNNAMQGAAQMGFYPRMEFVHLDLYDIDGTRELLVQKDPRVILNGSSLQPYWVITQLPKETFLKLKAAGYGPWLPLHLILTQKLMQAVKQSGIETHVVNAAFPDAVNPVLGKVGMAPTIGLGNMDNFIPGIQKIVGEKLGMARRDVKVWMVGHHYLREAFRHFGNSAGAPYFCKIHVGNRDVTPEFDLEKLLLDAVNLVVGMRNDAAVASSGVKNVLAILWDTQEITHSPGPAGLEGAYPIRLGANGAEVYLPEGLTLERAIQINREGQRLEGIERIEDDGTVVFTENANGIMKSLLGYDCPRMALDECDQRAKELSTLYKKFAQKYS